jgi:hypothetical protein
MSFTFEHPVFASCTLFRIQQELYLFGVGNGHCQNLLNLCPKLGLSKGGGVWLRLRGSDFLTSYFNVKIDLTKIYKFLMWGKTLTDRLTSNNLLTNRFHYFIRA